jgi:hypothetical protein
LFFAIPKAFSAHTTKALVTSFPEIVITFPFIFSATSLGIGSHPSVSGQTGIAFPCCTQATTFGQLADVQLYVQGIHAKQTLTIFMMHIWRIKNYFIVQKESVSMFFLCNFFVCFEIPTSLFFLHHVFFVSKIHLGLLQLRLK